MLTRILFLLLMCQSLATAAAPDKIRLQLRWLHQFQFAGYYMALEKGFYKEAGLDVELLEGGPKALKPVDAMLSGQVDFAVSNSGVIIERMAGKPVVALAAIMQTSPIVWIVRENSGIHTPLDLAGKNLMLMPPPESAELLATLRKEGIDISKLRIQPTSFNLNDLITGKTEAYDGYLSNEPYWLDKQGIGYRLINPREYGVNFYNDVLIGSERFLRDHPKQVDAFVRASLRGWEYALAHIDESAQLIHQRYAPGKSLEHLRYEARELSKLILPELVRVGHMNPGRWRHIAETYAELGMMKPAVNLDGFLYDPNPPPQDLTWLYLWLTVALTVGLLGTAISLHVYRINRKLKASEKLNLGIQESLRQAKETAENTLTEQRQFIAMVSHEFRSPLAVIDSASQLLAKKLVEQTDAAPIISRIRRGVARLSNFLENCLTEDRLDSDELHLNASRIDLQALATTVAGDAQHISERHRIVTELAADTCPLNGDPQLLHIMLLNLLSNAIKYSPPGSTVLLAIRQVDDRCQFEVSDQGQGISADELPHVFEKYRRGRGVSPIPGAGLGLSLVARIVALHGGEIDIDSKAGHGTRVSVRLPS